MKISGFAVAVTILAVVCVAGAPIASASTINVPLNQPTIQQAINVANAGDTVLVSAGVYAEHIDFMGKAITVTSVKGPAATILDGGNTVVPVVSFQSGEGLASQLSGFTIRNGAASFGSGVYLLGASPTITNNFFTGNNQGSGGFGAGIAGNGSSPDVERNVFWKNTCDAQGLSGVVSFVNSSSPLIADNIFYSNVCRAINMTVPQGTQPRVINNTIYGNSVGIHVDARVADGLQIFENNLLFSNKIGLEVVFNIPGNEPTWKFNDVFHNGVNYSGIANQTGATGNIAVSPAILSSSNYHLQFGSALIDAGDSAAPGLPATDFDGSPRIHGGVVDIGAFEFVPSAISLSSTALTFAGQAVGTTSPAQNLTVQNTGNAPLYIVFAAPRNFHQTSSCGGKVIPGGVCVVKITFKPTQVGLLTGSLSITDNAQGSAQLVSLTGTGN